MVNKYLKCLLPASVCICCCWVFVFVFFYLTCYLNVYIPINFYLFIRWLCMCSWSVFVKGSKTWYPYCSRLKSGMFEILASSPYKWLRQSCWWNPGVTKLWCSRHRLPPYLFCSIPLVFHPSEAGERGAEAGGQRHIAQEGDCFQCAVYGLRWYCHMIVWVVCIPLGKAWRGIFRFVPPSRFKNKVHDKTMIRGCWH